ncbi:MAG: helix-turn-helix domain-containing protein [Gemmatimonadaceae bacterium]
MNIVALVTDHAVRVWVDAAARPCGRVYFCEQRAELAPLATSLGAALVVTELRDGAGRLTTAALRDLRSREPLLPIIGVCRLTPGAARDIVLAARAGIDEVALLTSDDLGALVERAARGCPAAAAGRRVAALIQPAVPRSCRPLVMQALAGIGRGLTVTQLAAGLGTSRRTLERRCASARLPAPATLIDWLRVLTAAALLADAGWAPSQVAAALGFPSTTALRCVVRRVAERRLADLRAAAAFHDLTADFRSLCGPARLAPCPIASIGLTGVAARPGSAT